MAQKLYINVSIKATIKTYILLYVLYVPILLKIISAEKAFDIIKKTFKFKMGDKPYI